MTDTADSNTDTESGTRGKRADDRQPEGRRKRTPLGVMRGKLDAKIPDGFVGRWINDEGNRISAAIQGGWEFMKGGEPVGQGPVDLNSDLGSYTSQIAGTKDDGSPLRTYLMVIKREWYEEDQREKQRPVDEIDNQIRRGKFAPNGGSNDKQYVPSGGININSSTKN